MALYRLIRQLLRFVLGVFFRRIEIVGDEHVPVGGPVLFVGNHPNSLIDPAVIIAFGGRTVSFAAKDTLFDSGLLRPILRGLGAVPVRRRTDHGEGPVDNNAFFETLCAALAAGGAVGIFPEGLSHQESQLQPLKTGAARIAIGVLGREGGPCRIVPCGLSYSRPRHFRSALLVQFGEPIVVDDELLAVWGDEAVARIRGLTARVDHDMRALTVNSEDWDTVRVLAGVRRLYQPTGLSLEGRIELARRFNDAWPTVRHHPELRRLYDDVGEYLDRLDVVGLTDRDLDRDLSVWQLARRFYHRVVRVVLWMPLAAPGFVVHVPAAVFIRWAGVTFSPRKDVVATSKLVAGVLLLLLVYAGLGVVGWSIWGLGVSLALAPLLPLSGYATLRVLERYARLRRLVVTVGRFAQFRNEVQALRQERQRLIVAVVDAIVRFKPDDLEPLFLDDHPARLAGTPPHAAPPTEVVS